jgi:hypothetical protein
MAANRITGIGGYEGAAHDRQNVPPELGLACVHVFLKDGKPEYSVNDFMHVAAIGVDTKVSPRIKRTAIFEQLRQSRAIGSKGTRLIVAKTRPNGFERAIQPHCDAIIFDQLPIPRLKESASAQRDHRRMPRLNAAHPFMNSASLELTKGGLPALEEDLGNGGSFTILDFAIDVDKWPADFIGQSAPYSCLPSGHKADQVQTRSALQLKRHGS